MLLITSQYFFFLIQTKDEVNCVAYKSRPVRNYKRLIELFPSTEIFSKRRKIYALEGKPELPSKRKRSNGLHGNTQGEQYQKHNLESLVTETYPMERESTNRITRTNRLSWQ